MGFSVSGATAIVLLGMLIAFGAAFTAATNGFERVSGAQEEWSDRLVDQQNTDIEIVQATYNESGDHNVSVAVNNTGSQELSVEDTSLLVDGRFLDVGPDETDVDGDEDTDVWLPGEQLTFNVSLDEEPDDVGRVKVATETGVAATNSSTVTYPLLSGGEVFGT